MVSVTSLGAAVRQNRDWLATRARVVRPALRTVSFDPPHRPVRGNALISYMTEAFEIRDGALPYTHQNLWTTRQIARTLLEYGFHVDVINFRNFIYTPRRSYDVLVDNRNNMERLAPVLGPGCIKLHHIETSHMLFQNAAEFRRLLEVQTRRGVTLEPRRVERRVNRCIEHADAAALYGGEHSARTWAYAGVPMYPLPGTPDRWFPSPAGKPFDRVRRNFLWMGSNGLVLKGLDLVLEAFAGMPDVHLTVCGPVEQERDFAAAYQRELYEMPNITTLGWVDVRSASFDELVANTVGLVYPSASESQSGVVITALHAGLIPIVTPESGVDVRPFGRLLPEASIDAIRAQVAEVIAMPASELEERAVGAWSHARSTHTTGRFVDAYRAIVGGLLGECELPEPIEVPTGQSAKARSIPVANRSTISSTV